jgi:mannose-6-phosphate isomerase-like protein (cupin superfamily)
MVDGGEWFPGGTAVTRLRVYDWPTTDNVCGGSPHLHTASTEGYVVLTGQGKLQTLSGSGYVEHELAPGTLLWFTPGTIHRLVNESGDLEILVVMQNAGLPEAGDAVLTFPASVLADAEAYAQAVALPARERRDLAIEGYLALRERVQADGPSALRDHYAAAVALVRDKAAGWSKLWQDRVLAQAESTGGHLRDLASGTGDHLDRSGVYTATPGEPGKLGMCGRLQVWDLDSTRQV